MLKNSPVLLLGKKNSQIKIQNSYLPSVRNCLYQNHQEKYISGNNLGFVLSATTSLELLPVCFFENTANNYIFYHRVEETYFYETPTY